MLTLSEIESIRSFKKRREKFVGDLELGLDVWLLRLSFEDFVKRRIMVVYTIAQESRYLTVYNVPSLNIRDELLSLFALYGAIDE